MDVVIAEPNNTDSVEGVAAFKSARMWSTPKMKANAPKWNAKSSYDTLLASVAVQKDLAGAVKEVVADVREQRQYFKKIYRSIDKIHILQKKHFLQVETIEREKLKSFMEEMRAREVHYKL